MWVFGMRKNRVFVFLFLKYKRECMVFCFGIMVFFLLWGIIFINVLVLFVKLENGFKWFSDNGWI